MQEEYNLTDIVANQKHPHPSLKTVQMKMKGFDETLIMYVYHKLNGREDEAQSYLNEYQYEQDVMRTELQKQDTLEKSPDILINTDYERNQQYTPSYGTHYITQS